jgi:hypothetical protein
MLSVSQFPAGKTELARRAEDLKSDSVRIGAAGGEEVSSLRPPQIVTKITFSQNPPWTPAGVCYRIRFT